MSKRKLLLADDSVTIQKVVNLTFADEGIDVITVGDGNAAMAKISEAAPDVILADVHMPGLSGYQVCEMVRSNEATRELPVVLLVGSFEPFDENEAARVGANAFLTKPFQSIRQLVSQVSDLMQLAGHTSEPTSEAPAETTGEYADAGTDVDRTIPADIDVDVDVDRTTSPRVPDTTDIDKLYAQSVGDVPSEGAGESSPPTYVDAGMDDEMIETVHAGGADESVEEFHQEPTAEYQQPTSEYQLETSGFHEPVGGYEQSQPQEPAYTEPEPQYARPESQYAQPEPQYEQPEPQYEQPVDEYREPAVEYNEPTMAYEQPAEAVFQEEEPAAASPFDAPAEETQAIPLETYGDSYSRPAPDTATARTQEFALDEVDLLELPPMEGGQAIEFTTGPGAEGGRQVVSLSPELMDALVEKIVDKLSKKE